MRPRASTTANAPRAVFCRQWDWTFGSGQTVDRTFGIFNDTHDDSRSRSRGRFKFGGQEVCQQARAPVYRRRRRHILDERCRYLQ